METTSRRVATAGFVLLSAGLLGLGGAGPAAAIAGGKKAAAKDYPWLAAVRTSWGGTIGRPGGQVCAGALVAPTKVVTAAHCFDYGKRNVRVTFGRTNMRQKTGTTVAVVHVWRHPGFRSIQTPKKKDLYVDDVAVLTLAKAVRRPTLPLAAKSDEHLYQPGAKAVIVGWGNTTPSGGQTGVLHVAKVPAVSDARCTQAYGTSYRGIVCAGNWSAGKVDSCTWDSGGPLIIRGRLTGVVSGGGNDADDERCAQPKYPGTYTRLTKYHDALRKQIEK